LTIARVKVDPDSSSTFWGFNGHRVEVSITIQHLFITVAACLVPLACSAKNGANDPVPGYASKRSSEGAPAAADQSQGQPSSSNAASDSNARQVILMPPGRNPVAVTVEIARTPRERQVGLMYRKELAADAGMLFVFENPQQLSFWMRNTYVPLDMIFICADLTVLGVVENTTPLSDQSCSVPGLSQFVLEVNALFARRHGIAAGTRVRLPGAF
jgi:uncharacterized membrane protein (UPF0127 family)